MISIASFIKFAVTGLAAASSFTGATAVSLSRRQNNPIANCPDPSQIPFVTAAHAEALALANGAAAYISANGPTVEPFATYFGSTQDATKQLRVFSDAAAEHSETLHCTHPGVVCQGDFTAFRGNGTDDIFFCPNFYNQVPTGNLCTQSTVDQGGIRGATTLFVIMENVDDIGAFLSGDDCSDARNLASTHPETASDNAENYICFAMQVFVNTVCS